MARLDEQDFDEKRLSRRQRRKQGELFAYSILILFVLLLAGGIFAGVHFAKGFFGDKSTEVAEAEATVEVSEAEVAAIQTPEETPEVQEYTEDDILTEIIDNVLAEMSIEDKVAGLFVITPEQLTGVDTAVKAGSGTQEALSSYAVGGIMYAPKNIKGTDQIKEMLDTTQSMSKYPIFTIISEQGINSDAVISTLALSSDVESEEANFHSEGLTAGSQLFKYGFNFAVAPTIEVTEGARFGEESSAVKENAEAYAGGLKEAGVTACGALFPLKADTASQMGAVDISKDDLVVKEYEAFRGMMDSGSAGAIMVSNASFPQITGDNTPASLSNIMIGEELRGTLGFEGIVLTAPLNEGAITEYYTSAEAAVNAVKAGADMLCIPENFEESYKGLLDAVNSGDITEDRINESLRRIYTIKYADRVSQISN